MSKQIELLIERDEGVSWGLNVGRRGKKGPFVVISVNDNSPAKVRCTMASSGTPFEIVAGDEIAAVGPAHNAHTLDASKSQADMRAIFAAAGTKAKFVIRRRGQATSLRSWATKVGGRARRSMSVDVRAVTRWMTDKMVTAPPRREASQVVKLSQRIFVAAGGAPVDAMALRTSLRSQLETDEAPEVSEFGHADALDDKEQWMSRVLLLNVGKRAPLGFFPGRVVEMGWDAPLGSSTPSTSLAARLGLAACAWLDLDAERKRTVVVVCDATHGDPARLGLASAMVLRVVTSVLREAKADAAAEAYEAYLHAVGGDTTRDLALDRLPPSVTRTLRHVDFAVEARRLPNERPLVLLGVSVRGLPLSDAPVLAVSASQHPDRWLWTSQDRESDPGVVDWDGDEAFYSLGEDCVIAGDFCVLVRFGGAYGSQLGPDALTASIARYVASTAFLSDGAIDARYADVDVHPAYAAALHRDEGDFRIRLAFRYAEPDTVQDDAQAFELPMDTEEAVYRGLHIIAKRHALTPDPARLDELRTVAAADPLVATVALQLSNNEIDAAFMMPATFPRLVDIVISAQQRDAKPAAALPSPGGATHTPTGSPLRDDDGDDDELDAKLPVPPPVIAPLRVFGSKHGKSRRTESLTPPLDYLSSVKEVHKPQLASQQPHHMAPKGDQHLVHNANQQADAQLSAASTLDSTPRAEQEVAAREDCELASAPEATAPIGSESSIQPKPQQEQPIQPLSQAPLQAPMPAPLIQAPSQAPPQATAPTPPEAPLQPQPQTPPQATAQAPVQAPPPALPEDLLRAHQDTPQQTPSQAPSPALLQTAQAAPPQATQLAPPQAPLLAPAPATELLPPQASPVVPPQTTEIEPPDAPPLAPPAQPSAAPPVQPLTPPAQPSAAPPVQPLAPPAQPSAAPPVQPLAPPAQPSAAPPVQPLAPPAQPSAAPPVQPLAPPAQPSAAPLVQPLAPPPALKAPPNVVSETPAGGHQTTQAVSMNSEPKSRHPAEEMKEESGKQTAAQMLEAKFGAVNKQHSPNESSSWEGALGEHPSMKQWVKLLKVGLPRGAVAKKMMEEGVNPALLDFDLKAPASAEALALLSGGSSTSSTGGEPAPLRSWGKSQIKKATIGKKRQSLKPVHWEPLAGGATEGTVWASTADKGSVDESEKAELKRLFAVKPTQAKQPTVKKEVSQFAGYEACDAKRAANVAIGLQYLSKKFEGDLQAVARAVRDLDTDALSLENVEQLRPLLPSDSEDTETRRVFGDGNKEPKRPAEAFFVAVARVVDEKSNGVSSVAALRTRLGVLADYLSVDEACRKLEADSGALEQAALGARQSEALAEMLHRLLDVGNALNEGTHRGGAAGFKLASLQRISTTKSTNGESVLEFAARKPLKVADGLETLAVTLRRARKLNLDELKADLARLERTADALRCLESAVEQANICASKARSAREALDRAASEAASTARFFGEEGPLNVADLFGSLAEFVNDFSQARAKAAEKASQNRDTSSPSDQKSADQKRENRTRARSRRGLDVDDILKTTSPKVRSAVAPSK